MSLDYNMVEIFVAKVESRITSEMFIKHIANNYLGIQEDLIIEKNKYGKPFLTKFPNIHYNVSHTKGIIVCAISNDYIGIDVEKIKKFNIRIPKRIFTENENDYIFSEEENQNKRFFEIWTRKEAYVKWIGKGIELLFKSFDVLDEIRIKTIFVEDYVVSLCSDVKINLNEVALSDIIETIDKEIT